LKFCLALQLNSRNVMSCFCEQNKEKLSMQCEGDGPKCLMSGLGNYHQTPDGQIHYYCYGCYDLSSILISCFNLSFLGKINRIFWVNCACDDHDQGLNLSNFQMFGKNLF